jgi:predicted Zn-dependent protease with MMP-like domain
MRGDRFEALVDEALRFLPEKYKKLMDNVVVMVEDFPSEETLEKLAGKGGLLLGLYHGVSYKNRGPYYGNIPPDVIVIYQKPIEMICRSDKEIRKRVREVVIHEVGHHMGLSDAEMRDIEERK